MNHEDKQPLQVRKKKYSRIKKREGCSISDGFF